MEGKNTREVIAELIKSKVTVKRTVFEQSKKVLSMLKEVLEELKQDLEQKTRCENPIVIEIKSVGKYELRLKVGGDTILFLMHSNVFDFDNSHKIYRSSYVKNNKYNAYCGTIYMYNFLSDSFKYNRVSDLGYLMGRLFVNQDRHFFTEGKGRLSFLFNDFENAALDKKQLSGIVEEVLHQCLVFDLSTPEFKQVEVVTLDEITQVSNELKFQTGKKLGFKFKSDESLK